MKFFFSFFDYVFYRIAKAYKGTKDSSPEFAAVCVLSLLQCLNLFSVIIFIERKYHYPPAINKVGIGIIMIIGIIINAIRYNKLNYDILNERWSNDNLINQQRKGAIVLMYILLSIIAVFILIIWHR